MLASSTVTRNQRSIMQINVDKKIAILSGIILVLIAAVISVAVLTSEEDGYFGMDPSSMNGSSDLAFELIALAKLLLWLKGMTAHHDGAIVMAQMIDDAKNPEIKKFGEAIVIAQTAQNKQIAIMLKRIG